MISTMVSLEEFDLIVIGTGSGLDVANAACQKGLKVAIIEGKDIGETRLTNGCIPSSLLIYSTEAVERIRKAHRFGIKVDSFSIDFEKMVERVRTLVDSNSYRISKAYERLDNPVFFRNKCKFVSLKTILIGEDQEITADKILIAAGTRPRIPSVSGLHESGFITSDEVFRLKDQPHVLTIIGGGRIACETAYFFGTLGSQINMVQKRDTLLPSEDEEISERCTRVYSRNFGIHLGYETEAVSKTSDGKFHVVAKNSHGKVLQLDSDQLLVATGRILNSDILDLEKTDVKINEKGFIITDEFLETNVRGIFALGQFEYEERFEAPYAYNNIVYSDNKIPVDYLTMPHAIFSTPQVAGVGFTEQGLRNKGIKYLKSVYPYIKTAMGQAIEDKDGFVKFLVSKEDRRILGCHIIGSYAATLIHEVLVVMKASDGTIDSIAKINHICPSLSEVVGRSASLFDYYISHPQN